MRNELTWSALFVCGACGGTRVPAPSAAPAKPTAVSALAPSAAPAPAEARPPKVWTTAPDTDVCTEYENPKAPDFSRFETQRACEQWVHERRCRPGMSCNDGCNDVGCDGTGMHSLRTLIECGLAVSVGRLEF